MQKTRRRGCQGTEGGIRKRGDCPKNITNKRNMKKGEKLKCLKDPASRARIPSANDKT